MERSNVLYIEPKKMSAIENHNCEAIAWGSLESKKLNALKERLIEIDGKDGILGNEPELKDCIDIVGESIEINMHQTGHDRSEQGIIDGFMSLDVA